MLAGRLHSDEFSKLGAIHSFERCTLATFPSPLLSPVTFLFTSSSVSVQSSSRDSVGPSAGAGSVLWSSSLCGFLLWVERSSARVFTIKASVWQTSASESSWKPFRRLMRTKFVTGFPNKDKKRLVYLTGTIPVLYEGKSCHKSDHVCLCCHTSGYNCCCAFCR